MIVSVNGERYGAVRALVSANFDVSVFDQSTEKQATVSLAVIPASREMINVRIVGIQPNPVEDGYYVIGQVPEGYRISFCESRQAAGALDTTLMLQPATRPCIAIKLSVTAIGAPTTPMRRSDTSAEANPLAAEGTDLRAPARRTVKTTSWIDGVAQLSIKMTLVSADEVAATKWFVELPLAEKLKRCRGFLPTAG